MSTAYYLVCKDCKRMIHIGQNGTSFYSGEPACMKALGQFLYKHVHHGLEFCSEHSLDDHLGEAASWHDHEDGWHGR